MKKTQKNVTIRKAIEKANIRYWEVAKEYGITDSTFSRKLRQELSENEKQQILEIIKKITTHEKEH